MYKLDDSVYNELIRYETIYNFIYNSIVKYIRNKYSIDSLNAQLNEKWCQNRLNHYSSFNHPTKAINKFLANDLYSKYVYFNFDIYLDKSHIIKDICKVFHLTCLDNFSECNQRHRYTFKILRKDLDILAGLCRIGVN